MKLSRLRPSALAVCGSMLLLAGALAEEPPAAAPTAGPVEILPLDRVHPGLQATAWTAFNGTAAEAVPVEVLGVMKNAWGPRQDIILAKLGGKAERTGVAAGMSGSPVYADGKLLGAISLRFSAFSPDAIAGITPIELMLDIDEFDRSEPLPAKLAAEKQVAALESFNLAEEVWQSVGWQPTPSASGWAPIETPLTLSGLHAGVLDTMNGYFQRQGFTAVQGGAVAASAAVLGDPRNALNPGEPVAVVLMSGDMSASALGTVSYNDGRKILAFGHPMFNAGPLEAPIATGDVLLVLASKLAPVKIANASSIVGSLRQDRHSGILGLLGETAPLTPISVQIRTFANAEELLREETFRYQVIQNEKWTPQLLMLALFNSMFGLNDFAEESTFRLNARFDLEGQQRVDFRTMQTVTNAPLPAPLLLAGSVASRLQRVYTNLRETPNVESVDVSIDLLPERRLSLLEQVWVESRRVRPGDEIVGKVILRPYRGEAEEKDFRIRVPESVGAGKLTLLVSEAAALNAKRQAAAMRNRTMSLPETVSVLNQELSNDQIHIALLDGEPAAQVDDQRLPNIPLTALNVLRQSARGRVAIERQSPLAEKSLPVGAIVSGSRSLSIEVE